MSATFELQAAELRGLIERVFPAGKRRRSRMLAVVGTGYSGPLETAAGEFTVTTVRSELELRMVLPPITDDTPNLLVLVPWDVLPLDLSGRFAGHGRVLPLSPDRRLQSLLALDGKVAIDAGVWEGALATYLLRRGDPLEVSVGGGRLTKSGLLHGWLARWDVTGELGLGRLLAWAAHNERGPAFTEMIRESARCS
jgi:hypothetical protein